MKGWFNDADNSLWVGASRWQETTKTEHDVLEITMCGTEFNGAPPLLAMDTAMTATAFVDEIIKCFGTDMSYEEILQTIRVKVRNEEWETGPDCDSRMPKPSTLSVIDAEKASRKRKRLSMEDVKAKGRADLSDLPFNHDLVTRWNTPAAPSLPAHLGIQKMDIVSGGTKSQSFVVVGWDPRRPVNGVIAVPLQLFWEDPLVSSAPMYLKTTTVSRTCRLQLLYASNVFRSRFRPADSLYIKRIGRIVPVTLLDYIPEHSKVVVRLQPSNAEACIPVELLQRKPTDNHDDDDVQITGQSTLEERNATGFDPARNPDLIVV